MEFTVFSNALRIKIHCKQRLVFDSHFLLNQTALDQVGLSFFAGSSVWSSLMNNFAVGGTIAHVFLFWGPSIRESFRLAPKNEQPDRQYDLCSCTCLIYIPQAMQNYKEAPRW